MNRFKMFFAKRYFKELLPGSDASGSTGGSTGRELANEILGRIVYKSNSDTDYEDADFDFETLQTAYNTDSYVRQGVDKYVDQIFKEGYQFYGTDTNAVEYLKLRLAYIAEATSTPTNELLMEIAEDVVKYGNCYVVKARSNDPNAFPQGETLTGLYGKDAVAGYFCANAVVTRCKRDDYGKILSWQQKTEKGEQEFTPEDVVHFYYKREKGNAYGTSFLVPVVNDVRALRRAEENVLKMMYRNIYPFFHIKVGTEEATGTKREVEELQESFEDMEQEAALVTTERIEVKPIASDKVIEAEPYLKYMESRVFSGLGIPEIMFGRGNTANRSTGDNMTSEMADRIRAIQRIIEMFFNEFICKELLMEGGYDPVLNPDQAVFFKFNDNDVDVEIKKQVHAIYKYEHNSITEDEMRVELGMDPIPDGEREKMFVELITRQTLQLESQLNAQTQAASGGTGTKETNNKAKNGGGSPGNKAKTTKKDSMINIVSVGLIKDSIDNLTDLVDNYIKDCYNNNNEILQTEIFKYISDTTEEIITIISRETDSTKRINNKLVKLTTDLTNGINSDLIGINTYDISTESVNLIDTINTRIDLFKDSLVNYLVN